jgi:hypothetical protein
MPVELWLLITAVIFTAIGYHMGKQTGIEKAGSATFDLLVKDGYLRYRRNKQGEIEIMKWNELDG